MGMFVYVGAFICVHTSAFDFRFRDGPHDGGEQQERDGSFSWGRCCSTYFLALFDKNICDFIEEQNYYILKINSYNI
jgi:hypothetical protein